MNLNDFLAQHECRHFRQTCGGVRFRLQVEVLLYSFEGKTVMLQSAEDPTDACIIVLLAILTGGEMRLGEI